MVTPFSHQWRQYEHITKTCISPTLFAEVTFWFGILQMLIGEGIKSLKYKGEILGLALGEALETNIK